MSATAPGHLLAGDDAAARVEKPETGVEKPETGNLKPECEGPEIPTQVSGFKFQPSPASGPTQVSGLRFPPSRGSAASPLTPFEGEIVEVFVGLSKVFGFPKSYGEIYGLLFASAQPLSFADIQEKLDLSKGSVSQGLRALRELGAVRVATAVDGGAEKPETGNLKPEYENQEIGASGSQAPSEATQVSGLRSHPSRAATTPPRDYYVPVLELRRLVSAFLQASIDPQLAQSRANLTRAGELLPAEDRLPEAERELLFRRLEKLQTWHQRAKGLLPWAVRFLG